MTRSNTAAPTPAIEADGATFTWHGRADHVAVVGSWCDWRVEDALPALFPPPLRTS